MNAFSILAPILTLLGLAVVVAAIVFFAIKLRSGEPIQVPFRPLLMGYFYLLTIASFIVLLLGLSGLLNAGLSVGLGREFGYPRLPTAKFAPPPPSPPPGISPARPVPSVEEQRSEQERQQDAAFREGLLQGASMAVVGGVIWALHILGRRRLEKEEERRTGFFHKAYLIILLGICSLVSIFSLASGVYETLRFFLIPPIDAFSYRSPPGPILSTALVFVPPWAYYLRSVSRGLKGGERGA